MQKCDISDGPATLPDMEKIDVLLKPPALPDPDLEGFDPSAGTRRVRFAAFTQTTTAPVGMTVFRSVLRGLWAPAASLEISGAGKVFHADVEVEDEREEFVVVIDGNPDRVPADLAVFAAELQPPGTRPGGEPIRAFDGGGYAAEILEDIRRHLPLAVRADSLPEAVRVLKEEVPDLLELKRGVCVQLDIRVAEGRTPTEAILRELERRLTKPEPARAAQPAPEAAPRTAPPPPPPPKPAQPEAEALPGGATGT